MTRFALQLSWDETPHLSDDAKKGLADSYMPYERAARTQGVPSLGSGVIYPVPEEDILCDPFEFPAWYRFVYALDVGWNRTAALWGAIDPETDVLYLWAEHYRGQAEPPIHAEAVKARGSWIPGVIDPAARGRSQDDGQALLTQYLGLGLKLVPADNRVESGLYQVWTRLSTGKIKVFKTLQNLRSEYRIYRRDEKGKIIKDKDHLMDCYDRETEVLTSEGWMKFSDLTGHEPLATVNLRTDELQYQFPTELIAKPYSGKMVKFGGHKLDGLVTPNHRMVVYPRHKDAPTIRHAHELTVWDRVKLNAKWKGIERGTLKVEKTYGRDAEVDPIVWAEMLGWYVAEGWHRSKPQIPGCGYQVGISQVNPEKIEILRALLAKTPWNWTYRESHHSFEASCQWLWEALSPLGNKYKKFVPVWIKRSEPRIIEAFINGAVAGDGWVQNGRRSYASVSRRLADDMQELFIKTGVSASVLLGRAGKDDGLVFGRPTKTVDQWWVHEWVSPYGLLRDSTNKPNYGQEDYDGMVYCATVPNGTLVVRRNGKPMVAGNCLRYLVTTGLPIAAQRPYDQALTMMRAGTRAKHQVEYQPMQAAWSPQQPMQSGQPRSINWTPHGPNSGR